MRRRAPSRLFALGPAHARARSPRQTEDGVSTVKSEPSCTDSRGVLDEGAHRSEDIRLSAILRKLAPCSHRRRRSEWEQSMRRPPAQARAVASTQAQDGVRTVDPTLSWACLIHVLAEGAGATDLTPSCASCRHALDEGARRCEDSPNGAIQRKLASLQGFRGDWREFVVKPAFDESSFIAFERC